MNWLTKKGHMNNLMKIAIAKLTIGVKERGSRSPLF